MVNRLLHPDQLTQFTALLDTVSEGIAIFDDDDRLVLANQRYYRLYTDALGAEMAEIVKPGAILWDYLDVAFQREMFPLFTATDWQRFKQSRKAERKAGQSDLEYYLRDGTWVRLNGQRVSGLGFVTCYTDITDLKTSEAQLNQQASQLQALSERLSRYLPPQVYGAIFRGEKSTDIVAERKKLTVFFSDVAGFTEMSDRLESEDLTYLLNSYLTAMSKIALEHGATVDKFIGDAVLAFFGDPVTHGARADAEACIAMALAMRQRILSLQEEWRDLGIARTFDLRIGIATGFCTVGNFGSAERMDYTVIGNTVNLASRLQALAEVGHIVLAEETYLLVKDTVSARPLGSQRLKGFIHPVMAYEVTDSEEGSPTNALLTRNQEGLRLRLDTLAMSADAKASAIKSLREALANLEDQC